MITIFMTLYCLDLKIQNTKYFNEREQVFSLQEEQTATVNRISYLYFKMLTAKAEFDIKEKPAFDSIRSNLEYEYRSIQGLNLAQKIEKYSSNEISKGGN